MTEAHVTRYPANWPVRFLCDCKKQGKPITIREGFAHDISTSTMRIRSDHHICSGKEVAIMLKIPPLDQSCGHALVKLVGRSLITVVHEGDFLTEIEFSRFEDDGLERLKNHLSRRFDSLFFASLTRMA
ncbi:MAG: hypothetical protein KKG03_02540 [Gammaproteobacteria bacterium]|nr:hypothetical protein [Sideroxydans sp.]MBU3903968.1 hypothetical protein [Gammaproteobacteria bacterium]MBU4046194.1 hypothetical protein [Gammaproteobacteria bacterium]MBU4150509.1 hypothetical protein [Gammaproteobacteria bacterium]